MLCLGLLLLSHLPFHRAFAADTLLVGAVENYPPFSYVDKTGYIKGIDVDVIRAAAEILGYKLKFAPMPFKRILYNLKNGTIDAGLPGFSRPERHQYASYPTTPLRVTPFYAFSLKKDPL